MANYSLDLEATSSQYVTVAEHANMNALDGASACTVEFWVKLETIDALYLVIQRVATVSEATGQIDFRIRGAGANDVEAYFTEDGSNYHESYGGDTTFVAATWYHLAAVFDNAAGTKVIHYINGTDDNGTYLATGTPTSLQSVDGTTYIGSRSTGAFYLDGKIFDVRIWSVGRTSTQINDNYNLELVGNEAGLVLNILFDNSTTNKVSGGSDGVLQGSPVYSEDTPAGYTFQGGAVFTPKAIVY